MNYDQKVQWLQSNEFKVQMICGHDPTGSWHILPDTHTYIKVICNTCGLTMDYSFGTIKKNHENYKKTENYI